MNQVTALNADIVGYSRLLADHPSSTAARLDDYKRLVEDQVSRSSGTLVSFVGDNFMAVFDAPEDALRGAISITNSVEDINTELSSTERMRFRMGLDCGEVLITEDGQYVGDALNIAARIQAQALPGGISISGPVFKALDEPSLRFRSVGPKNLKNIPEPVHMYEFADLPAEADAQRHDAVAFSDPVVALLPLHTESVDEKDAALGAPVSAEIAIRLSKIPNLTVIDSSSSSSDRAGDETGPVSGYFLETGMFSLGEQVRIYAQLVETGTINIVWSDRWDADKSDILALADNVANDIGRVIEVELIVGAPARIYNDLLDQETLTWVYQGWYELTSATPHGWMEAIRQFGKVADAGEHTLVGHGLLAYAHWMGAAQGFGDAETQLALAKKNAQAGIDLGDETGLSHTVMSAICLDEGKPDDAIAVLEEAEILRPTCDVTFGLEASIRRYMGQWETAVDLAQKAMDMTPVVKPWYPTVLASSYYVGKRYEDAAALAERVVEHQPRSLEAWLVLTASQSALGLDRRAQVSAEQVRERFPTTTVSEWLGRAPFQDEEVIDRWRSDLAGAGLS